MREEEQKLGGTLGPHDFRKVYAINASRASEGLGWDGLEAARFGDLPAAELDQPAITHHGLVLLARPPAELDLRFEGVNRHVPPPAGAIIVVPAGTSALWRWSGRNSSLHIYLKPDLVARVGALAFGLDPARVTLPPVDGDDLPHLRAAMWAVDAELATGGPGGRLAAESLANVLAVHLIRHALTPRRLKGARDGALPRARLRAVIDYIEGTLQDSPSLDEMAAVARLSPYHFARQFKAATGLPPHQYVIMRRVERAKDLLQAGTDLALAQVAARAGFSDQSQFSHHFKRLVGVTPGQFRTPAIIA
jgi:AraC family transcriptional regulator